MAPFTLTGIDHILLLVDDMDAALRFYRDELGATEVERIERYGMVELAIGASSLALVDIQTKAGSWARPQVAGGRNIDHFCVRVTGSTLDELRTWAGRSGRTIIEEREGSIYLMDPAGNQIELTIGGLGGR